MDETEKLLNMSIKQGEDIASIKSQVTGMTGWIKDILTQTKKTNGNVASTITDVRLLKQSQKNHVETCPARKYVTNPTMKDMKDWSMKKAAIIITIVITLISVTVQIVITHFGG